MNESVGTTNVLGSSGIGTADRAVRRAYCGFSDRQDQVILVVGQVLTTLASAVEFTQVDGQGDGTRQHQTAESNKNSYIHDETTNA